MDSDRVHRLLDLVRQWTLALGGDRNWNAVEATLHRWDSSLGMSRPIVRTASPALLGHSLGAAVSDWVGHGGAVGRSTARPSSGANAQALLSFAGPPAKDPVRETTSLSDPNATSEEDRRIGDPARQVSAQTFEIALKVPDRTIGGESSFPPALVGTCFEDCMWTTHDMMNMDLVCAGLDSPLQDQSTCLREAVGHGLFMLGSTRTAIFVLLKPKVHKDSAGRLHNDSGPAIEWDDFMDRPQPDCFYLHGVKVDGEVITNPNSLTPHKILATANIEERRAYIERFGLERLLTELGKKPSRTDQCGRLWRLRGFGADPLVVVEVMCPSTNRKYLIQVPPDMKTPRAAVAWTFVLSEKNYRPKVET